jgi:hypothetical protein
MAALRFTNASDLFDAFVTARQDVSTPARDEPPIAFLQALAAGDKPFDAVAFGAYLLPRREAVRWSLDCLRRATRDAALPADMPLQATQAWLKSPEEANRLAALRCGMEGDPLRASTWTALAAGWAGATVPFGDHAPVPSQPWMTARAVRAATAIALAQVGRQERQAVLQDCVGLCIAIAEDRAPPPS